MLATVYKEAYAFAYQLSRLVYEINLFGCLREGKGAKGTRKLTETFWRNGHSSCASNQGATPEQLPVRFSSVTWIPPDVNEK